MTDQIADLHHDIYTNYYGDAWLARKREITARQTMSHIREIVGNRKFAAVADVGAGEGSVAAALSASGTAEHVTAFEISASGLEAISHRKLPDVTVSKFDGYKAPASDKQFDLALSIHVLEHVEHERLFLHEIKRISKQAIIEVPLEHTFGFQKRIATVDAGGHINHYTPETFHRLLSTSGLKVVKMITYAPDLEYEKFLYGTVKGTIKNTIRAAALRLAPGIATSNFVYLCAALVDCG